MSQTSAYWNFAALEGLRADARTRILSRSAFGMLMRLVLEARGDATVSFLNHHDAVTSVAAYDLRECDTSDGGSGARAAVQELVDAGFLVLDDAARVIHLDLHEGALARTTPSSVVSAEVITAPRAPRRPPAWSPERTALRKLQWQFRNRVGPFRAMALDADLTWEVWSATPDGGAFLAARASRGSAPEVGPEQGREQPRNKGGNNPEQPRNNPGTTLSPTPPFPEETKGNQAEGGQRAGEGNNPGTTPGNNPRNKGGNNREQPPRGRRVRAHLEDTPPLPGTQAEAVYRAIVEDPALRPITGNPGDLAGRLVGGMFPHLDAATVAAQVRHAGAHAARKPGQYSDGGRFLINWLKNADADAAARPKPAAAPVTASSPKNPRDGIQPPAPASAFEHVALARALGVKWPGYEPTAETKEQAFLRITGRTIEAARAEVAAQAATKRGAAS